MPIQMTAQQYMAKYGSSPLIPHNLPPASNSGVVSMTREQYQAKYGQPPGSSAPVTTMGGFQVPQATINRVAAQGKPALQGQQVTQPQPQKTGIAGDFQNRLKNVNESMDMSQAGKQTGAETFLQTAGQVAGAGTDLAIRGVSKLNQLAGAGFPQPIKNATNATMNALTHNPVAEAGLQALSKGVDAYNQWRSNNLRTAKNLEAVFNIASVLPAVKGAEEGTKVAGTVAKDAAQAGVETAGKAINPIRDAVTPMEKGVKNILEAPTAVDPEVGLITRESKNTAMTAQQAKIDRLNKYLEQAKNAAVDYHLPTPLDTAGKRGEDALKIIGQKMQEAGKSGAEELSKNASTIIKNVDNVRQDFLSNVKERTGLNITKTGIRTSPGRLSNISDTADKNVITNIHKKLLEVSKNPTAQKVSDAVDYIQSLVKYKGPGAIPVNTKVSSIAKTVVRDLNAQLHETIGPVYEGANKTYGQLKDVRDTLNKALGSDISKGGSLMKRVFSPTDGGTKNLFNKVKNITGIDLTEEATLAKYAMESAGDSRQANLLEQLDLLRKPSIGSFVGKAAHKILQVAQDKPGKAIRTAEKSLQRLKK